jgi:cytochrome b6-f complex iron-sulfur subunit
MSEETTVEEQPKPVNEGKVRSAESTTRVTRRRFLSWFGVGWTAFVAANAAMLALMGRFMFPNVLFEAAQSFNAGSPADYPVGEVSLRWVEKYGVWIVRNNEQLYALSTTCTHLGCTPSWLVSEGKFKCPCHGSGFYVTGINFEGPAPRPLERYGVTLDGDGQIVVDKTQKFQQEKGQWSDPDSYLVV